MRPNLEEDILEQDEPSLTSRQNAEVRVPHHLHLDGGVIFGDHLVHEEGHVGDVCLRPFTWSETFRKLCLPAKECVRGESWVRTRRVK